MPATAHHGTPITPYEVLESVGPRDMCVSFYRPDQVEWIDQNSRSWFGDCGTYSFWISALKSGVQPDAVFTRDYLDGYYAFGRRWALEGSGRCKWLVIPDPIGTGTQELDALIREWPAELKDFGVPVYHLDEPIERAVMLLGKFGRLCIGATGEFRVIGSPEFCARMDELFNAIYAAFGCIPWTHMFRGFELMKPKWDWEIASFDSADRARNHNRLKPFGEHYRWAVRQSFDRWDNLALARAQAWPPPRLLAQPNLFGEAA